MYQTAKLLIDHNQDLNKNILIARILYQVDPPKEIRHRILKDSKRKRLVQIEGPEGTFQVLFLLDAGPKSADNLQSDKQVEGQLIPLDRQDLAVFLEKSGDQNPLHQGKRPLLPAFLLLDACLPYLAPTEVYDFRFLNPAYLDPDRSLVLSKMQDNYLLCQEGKSLVRITLKKEI